MFDGHRTVVTSRFIPSGWCVRKLIGSPKGLLAHHMPHLAIPSVSAQTLIKRRYASVNLQCRESGMPAARLSKTSQTRSRRSSVQVRLFVFLCLMLLAPLRATSADWVYSVVPGDNLWDFSQKYLDSVTRFDALRKLNNIERPRRMRPGTQIRVPMEWITSNAVPATIADVQGVARLTRASGETLPLKGGERASLGDRLNTDSDSSVIIRFADASLLTLHESSAMRFDHLSAHGETGMVDSRVNLLSGRLETRVQPTQGPGSRFEISTPAAISAVRGTEYRAAATAASANIEVIEGSVEVAGSGASELLPEGFGTQIETGAPPLPPRELLPAPRLDPIPDEINRRGSQVSWERVNGAQRYRLEVSRSPNFDTIQSNEVLQAERGTVPELPDGRYFLRVRAIDEIGLEGLDARRGYVLNAYPEPPTMLAPNDSQRIRSDNVVLRWNGTTEAERYRVEVAADPYFNEVIDTGSSLATTDYEFSSPGNYGDFYWRIASIAAGGDLGPFGEPQQFSLQRVLPTVEIYTTELSPERVQASWTATEPKVQYQVQLAGNAEFRNPDSDTIVDKSNMDVERTQRRQYLRVRSVATDGDVGTWSDTEQISARESSLGDSVLVYLLMVLIAL